MAKKRGSDRKGTKSRAAKDKKRTKAEIASARRQLAANKPKRGKKKARPTKFQNFLMKEGRGAIGKVKAWKHLA
jgi:hypothetical protein